MNIEFLIQDRSTGNLHDFSKVVTSIEWETTMLEQPGKLTFEYVRDGKVSFSNGSVVRVKVKNNNVFYGYVFSQTLSNDMTSSVTAYDAMRYLQNKDILVMSSMTSSQLFAYICTNQQLPYRIVDPSYYTVAAQVFDNKSYYEMIQAALDSTLTNVGVWYIIRDNFGTLEHVNVSSLKTNLFIGDKSLLTDYEYEKSIDSETYNYIKLTKDNTETSKREVYIAKDSSNISKWGRLQYFESMDEDANEAQIIARANMLLKLKNRETKTLKFTCIGDFRVRAGSGVIIGVEHLKNEDLPYDRYAMVSSCTHKFTNNMHEMDLSLEIV